LDVLEESPGAVRIAVVQLAARADHSGFQDTLSAIDAALNRGAQVIVLPELASSGYSFSDREEAWALSDPADGQVLDDWRQAISGSDALLIGGFCERDRATGNLYNSAALIAENGVVAIHRKIHLWDKEKLYFEAGSDLPPVVETRFGTIGMAICLDISFPEIPRALALSGAELIALPVACPAAEWPKGDYPSDVIYYRAAAQANRVFVAVADWGGQDAELRYLGWSLIVDEHGMPIAGPPERASGEVIAECSLAQARDKTWGAYNDLFEDRRPELYGARRVVKPSGSRTSNRDR